MQQLHVAITNDQKGSIASIINASTTIDLGIKGEQVTDVWVLGDMFYLWYRTNNQQICYPVSMKRFNEFAKNLGLSNIFLKSVNGIETEMLTQYCGFWINTGDIVGKMYVENKIEYKVKLRTAQKVMTVKVPFYEYASRIKKTVVVDREAKIKEMEQQLI